MSCAVLEFKRCIHSACLLQHMSGLLLIYESAYGMHDAGRLKRAGVQGSWLEGGWVGQQ